MNPYAACTLLAISLLWPACGYSLQNKPAETWERDEAWRSSTSVNTKIQHDQLRQLLKAGDHEGTLRLIRAIEQQNDWPAPARERLIFEYVSELRQEPPRSVSNEVIDYLRGFRPTVFVPHEDHPRASVAMFNISTATAGIVNGWSRQEAAYQGAAFLAAGAQGLVQAFATEESLPRRQGLLDALSTATPAQLNAVARHAVKGLDQSPRLLALAGNAALLNRDFETLEQMAEAGRGVDMPALFRDSAQMFDTEQNSRLLKAALQNPSPTIAALAIAHLTPSLARHTPT
jgi:hypothetical protein